MSMEVAAEDFSGGLLLLLLLVVPLLPRLLLPWLEMVELVITFFCCK